MPFPLALFTFLELQSHPAGVVFAVAVDPKGKVLARPVAESLLVDPGVIPGEVTWNECERAFAESFASVQEAAAKAARDVLAERAAAQRVAHEKTATVLREEAALYRVDRLAEIDADEKAERAGSREQMELFRDAATNWQARRAAVDTHYGRRLKDIEQYAQVPEPPDPQALGVLLVFPPR